LTLQKPRIISFLTASAFTNMIHMHPSWVIMAYEEKPCLKYIFH